ncbi:hypothetical protein IAE60_08225 [Pseudoxanthomonas mexicana]|uniref:Uncharacterized protein n=1 Tax=Pseudoxanthomonas mexicana TaxID=128785 RepID=A0A7G9TGZ9_PSEMX|nr:hypothetical protein [Pseudoxanthomonas mexicana]QNN79374.1 hypothetical protein IAE60_08225 [Pseudoxanthomonas mexicana]UOV00915.1 hypothetical protein MUU73_13075 [Pseudoxanthomonas mexicana]
MPPATRRPSRWLVPLMLLLGGASLVLIWVTAALYLHRQAGWMALLAALDVIVVLRLAGMPAGAPRAALALVATAVICGMSLWGIVATQLGFALGLTPWDSALKLGLHHGWTLLMLAMTPLDWIALALAPPVAAWGAR